MMGREVRKVPPNWNHPQREDGIDIPLLSGDPAAADAEWLENYAQWKRGYVSDWKGGWEPKPAEYKDMRYTDYNGPRPNPEDYMPQWTEGQATHFMMYENTSEGTPISPAFATAEELARWLADTGASAFGNMTATYEQWLSTCKRGWAISAVASAQGLASGVEALAEGEQERKP